MLKRRTKKQLSEINVVPYIDVMLVLLIIFMVTAPLLSQGIKVDLPQAKSEPIATKLPEPIIVSIDARGNYYLNTAANPKQPLSPQELAEQIKPQLQPLLQKNTPRQVLVKGDKNVDYGKVVAAMSILQQAGAPTIGLMTQNGETSSKRRP